MTETFRCDDKDGLVAYLYDEISPAARVEVDRHLQRCAACAAELAALQGARLGLAAWQPPDADLGLTIVAQGAATTAASPAAGWAAVPAWAQAAAALLVLAVGLGAANLQVRYDAAGLVVTTGWMTPAPAATAASPAPVEAPVAMTAGAPVADEAWREALAALETRLRADMTTRPVAAERTAPAGVDAEALLARVRALIEESELRQRQELAYRLTQFNRDMEMQRRADLVRIERGVGQIEGRTGAEVARQREMLNYLVRVAQRPQ